MQRLTSQSACKQDYTLPDGDVITLNSERFHCTAILFNPDLIDQSGWQGIRRAAHNSIRACDNDLTGPT